MKNFKARMRKMLESKMTTAVAITILLIPFLVFGFILYRDSSQTGVPVVGDRFKDGLNPEITSEQLSEVESKLVDELIVKKKVSLKSATLRIYLEVDGELSKEQIKTLADTTYDSTIEVLPLDPYFTLDGTRKQYDLEIHVYNNVEDRTTPEFVYYQIMKTSSMEKLTGQFLSDAVDPSFKDEVLENLAEKEKAAAEEAENPEGIEEAEETEEDESGE